MAVDAVLRGSLAQAAAEGTFLADDQCNMRDIRRMSRYGHVWLCLVPGW